MALDKVERQAPSARVEDERGAIVELADLHRDRPAVLIFLRHFG